MDEHIRAAIVLLDESKALIRVEPLHGASSHALSFTKCTCRHIALDGLQAAHITDGTDQITRRYARYPEVPGTTLSPRVAKGRAS